MDRFLKETALLDYRHPSVEAVIQRHGWRNLSNSECINQIYDHVRDRIPYGYSEDDALAASAVLSRGYGHCNTKSIVLMSFLRACGIPCRVHGFSISRSLQKGIIPEFWYLFAPEEMVHSWVEVKYSGTWINLEGFVLDLDYLREVQALIPRKTGEFCGYCIATSNIDSPEVFWNGSDTYIQKEGILRDFGSYDSPDEMLSQHPQELRGLGLFLYRKIVRASMNTRIELIRKGGLRKKKSPTANRLA